MNNFKKFGLPEELINSLARMDFKNPTPIQEEAIPFILEGRDILGTAQTGTGKTAAFILPIITHLMGSQRDSALILTPTRELAIQIMNFARKLLVNIPKITIGLLVGGEYIGKQLNQLRSYPRLVIGTPGRINDHLNRKTLKLNNTKFFVVDESDRMLDMGFGVQLDEIIKHLPKEEVQTMMFSATLPNEILRITNKYLDNPERVSVGSTEKPILNIKQDVLNLTQRDKYPALLEALNSRAGSILIFVQTKISSEKLTDKLRSDNHSIDYLHGDLKQSRREKVIRAFRGKKYRILVATDIVSRGIDIPHIEHVINFDLPQSPEDYIHRIGRTARAGTSGSSLAILGPQDKGKWMAIQRLLDPEKYKALQNKFTFRKKVFRDRNSRDKNFKNNGKRTKNSR